MQNDRRTLLHVAILSALGLALELLLIRWLDAEVRALAYFKNLILIAAFLGLGIGYATVGRKTRLVPYATILVSLLLAIGGFLGSEAGTRLQSGPASPESNLGLRVAGSPAEFAAFSIVVCLLFVLTVVALIPIGQLTGEYLRGIPPVRGYSANIAGSLAGVLSVVLLASASIPPWIPAAICLAALTAYIWHDTNLRAVSVIAALLAIGTMASLDFRPGQTTIWSSYNKIELMELKVDEKAEGAPTAWMLRVQNLYFQHIMDLSPGTLQKWGHLDTVRKAEFEYGFPYRFRRDPGNVLVLGAGTGNDVAAALRAGARSVDAVEIDPMILDAGRRLHPEKPYDDPRVNVIIDDARAHLRATEKKYDMIVFGLLDAHTSFYSSLTGGIRLDNYVYTVESYRQSLARLAPGGVLVVSFYVEQPWVATRMAAMMEAAAGTPPMVSRIASNTFTYFAGPGAPVAAAGITKGLPPEFARVHAAGPLSTDDWPFIYLRDRRIPPMIVVAAVVILIATALVVARAFRGDLHFSRHYFFLGAGFLLLETRTIAQLALLYGTTWRVSAVAIAAILTMILLANLAITKWGPLRLVVLYPLLLLALAFSYFIRPADALAYGTAGIAGMTLLLALPLLFAALIFSSSITAEANLSRVFASNLVGSVAGGLLENVSLIFGIAALNVVALVLYALSFRKRPTQTTA